MILLYAIICALIALRLITYRRAGARYRPANSILAYVMIVAAGSVPLRAAMGMLPPPDLTAIVLSAAVLAAVVGAQGSVGRFMPRRRIADRKSVV